MRTEQEMYRLILDTAQSDPRVRLVALNGSRANPQAPRDAFQDFDVVYFVTDMAPFLADPSWIDVFGERVILQTPEDGVLFPPSLGGAYTYLMLFADGNRIDLMLRTLDMLEDYLQEDTQTVILLDKDGRCPPLPPPSDRCHWVKRPSQAEFWACCNEFWWLSPYVLKGICRGEILYAAEHLHALQGELVRMLGWQVGCQTGFSVSVGKCGKYLEQYLPSETWQALLATCRCDSYPACRRSLFDLGRLFSQSARAVAAALGYPYREEEERRVTAYLNRLLDRPAG